MVAFAGHRQVVGQDRVQERASAVGGGGAVPDSRSGLCLWEVRGTLCCAVLQLNVGGGAAPFFKEGERACTPRLSVCGGSFAGSRGPGTTPLPPGDVGRVTARSRGWTQQFACVFPHSLPLVPRDAATGQGVVATRPRVCRAVAGTRLGQRAEEQSSRTLRPPQTPPRPDLFLKNRIRGTYILRPTSQRVVCLGKAIPCTL